MEMIRLRRSAEVSFRILRVTGRFLGNCTANPFGESDDSDLVAGSKRIPVYRSWWEAQVECLRDRSTAVTQEGADG